MNLYAYIYIRIGLQGAWVAGSRAEWQVAVTKDTGATGEVWKWHSAAGALRNKWPPIM